VAKTAKHRVENRQTRIQEIELLEEALSITLPDSYADFLEAQAHGRYMDISILGLPITPALDSVWGATELLWNLRPNLHGKVIAVEYRDDSIVCLQVGKSRSKDNILLLVNTSIDEDPKMLAETFESFLLTTYQSQFPEDAVLTSLDSFAPEQIVKIFLNTLQIEVPDSLATLLADTPAAPLDNLAYRLNVDPLEPTHLTWALRTLGQSYQPAPKYLIPIMPVDSRSFACVVCNNVPGANDVNFGKVIRWHLDNVPAHAQGCIIDTDPVMYLRTVSSELATRETGLAKIAQLAERYDEEFLQQHRIPKAHEIRPIRLAVQNVIVGLAAFRLDNTFDGLAIEVWQTCEVPHLNAQEACRALASMTLAEAFRCGSTMELRFDNHPEKAVPGSLLRYARSRGITLGANDKKAITPEESRELFREVTQMPINLSHRVHEAVKEGGLSSERACFVLMANIWRPIELEFILAVSHRSYSILQGGVEPFDRVNFQAEASVCRSAHMLGLLLARLRQQEDQDQNQASALEDTGQNIQWSILPEFSAVRFETSRAIKLPWLSGINQILWQQNEPLFVFPRTTINPEDLEAMHELRNNNQGRVVALTPEETFGTALEVGSQEFPKLICPEKIIEIDRAIDVRLLSCRVGRV